MGGLVLPVWEIVERAIIKQARAADRRIHVMRIVTTGAFNLLLDTMPALPMPFLTVGDMLT